MSTDKNGKVEDILQRLKYAKKFNTWKEVGEYLGEKEATISIWRKRNSPSAPEKILYRCHGDVPERYLLTGEGPMSASGPTMKDVMFRTPHNSTIHTSAATVAPLLNTGTIKDAKIVHFENGIPHHQSQINIDRYNHPAFHKAPSQNIDLSPHTIKKWVPVISWVQAGTWAEVVDNYRPGDGEELVPTTKNVSDNAFALRVSGTSMEPDYRDGDTIIVDPGYEVHNGSLVVVRMNHDGEATFKKLHFDGDMVFLEPLNPRYQPMDITGKDYTICGVVRQMVRDIM